MSSFHLKLLAMLSMLIDHIGAILFPQYIVLRIIGRLAFPIYCFLLVQGYNHTSNLKKYFLRLGLFALLSEIPFDLALQKDIFDIKNQNIFFTLLIGLLAVHCYNYFKYKKPIMIISIISLCILATIINCDYGAIGVLMILGFCIYKDKKVKLVLWEGIVSLPAFLEFFGLLAFIPIFLYNSKKGYNIKYLFYMFYPLHLLILYFISNIDLI